MRFVSRALMVTLPMAAAVTCSAFVWTRPAAAQEDTMRQEYQDLKNAVGLGSDHTPIDFSDRPPLVVPPTYTLPPPGSGVTTLGVDDPDTLARRKALSDARRPVPPTDPGAGATGLASRTYLTDPPSGLRDPSMVASGIETDGSQSSPAAKPTRHHHHKQTAAEQ